MTLKSLIGNDDLDQMLALARSTPYGAFIEVGVYQGGSAMKLARLAKAQNRFLYLCDTFCGIPYRGPDDSHEVGDFADCDLAEMVKEFRDAGLGHHVEWVEGVFPGSWKEAPGLAQTKFAFAHLDCDQYQSVKDASEWLIPRMVKGGVIWFDDVDRLAGATRAALEVFGQYGLRREYSHPYVKL